MSRSLAAFENPYLPPETDANAGLATPVDRFVPAPRWSRLAARALDTLFDVACFGPALGIVALGKATAISFSTAMAITFFLLLALHIYQWALLATIGQTIGKRMLRIRLVRTDGAQPGFGGGVVLRSWLMMLLAVIPIVNLVAVLDLFFILGGERRCLHDFIAGTRVVTVELPAVVTGIA